ncbi:MAG: hypothetical protein JWL81_422 [Verrucomicrobiales bacterium]|nr:hypothetical protein [Verrucomicrobiales bacterium]
MKRQTLRKAWEAVRQRLVKAGLLEAAVLISLLVIAGSVWGFLALTSVILDGGQMRFDEGILLFMREPGRAGVPRGPVWLPQVMKDLTALGGAAVLSLLSLSVVGFLLLERKGRIALLVVASITGGLLLAGALKSTFHRPRPEVVPHLTEETTTSFPSGHSMLSAVTYLTLGTLLARHYRDHRLKIFFLSAAAVIAFVVGLSRVYLGVHYPSDVLAGWCAGTAWALLCDLAACWLQRRGQVEPEVVSAE